MTPSAGPLSGGNYVTVEGTHLGAGSDIATVLFGTQSASIQPGQTSSLVVVQLGAFAAAGAVAVSTSSPSFGTSVAGVSYTVNPGTPSLPRLRLTQGNRQWRAWLDHVRDHSNGW